MAVTFTRSIVPCANCRVVGLVMCDTGCFTAVYSYECILFSIAVPTSFLKLRPTSDNYPELRAFSVRAAI